MMLMMMMMMMMMMMVMVMVMVMMMMMMMMMTGAYIPERATSMHSCHGVSRTSLFLERLWREFSISFKFHKRVSKTYRPKNVFFLPLMRFSFPF